MRFIPVLLSALLMMYSEMTNGICEQMSDR